MFVDDLVDRLNQDVAFQLIDPYGRPLDGTLVRGDFFLSELDRILSGGTHTLEVSLRTNATVAFSGQLLHAPAAEIPVALDTVVPVSMAVKGSAGTTPSTPPRRIYTVEPALSGGGSAQILSPTGRALGDGLLFTKTLALGPGTHTVRVDQSGDGALLTGTLRIRGPAVQSSASASVGDT
ncbi:MAG: hypothetical protein H6736_21720 [Alphaproteobacteria bacterium]|nr:hypothetical protein [Alphaproteobacteria bacterium]